MKTDRELLELAAKAARVQIVGLVDSMIVQPDHRAGGYVVRNDKGGDSCWNPLTDDADALRLAVKLRLTLIRHPDGMDVLVVLPSGKNISEQLTLDANEYMRRAIVRAAAEIGEAYK